MNPNTGLETEDESPEKRKLFNVERIKEGKKLSQLLYFSSEQTFASPAEIWPISQNLSGKNSAVLSFIKEWKEGNCPLMAEFSPPFPGETGNPSVCQAELTCCKYATEIDAIENKFREAWVRFPFLLFYFVLQIGKSEQWPHVIITLRTVHFLYVIVSQLFKKKLPLIFFI